MDLAIGFFDGVHLGHQQILPRADAVLTFATHPLEVLAPDRAPALLMTLDERLDAIRSLLRTSSVPEAKRVRALPFTAQLAAVAPEDFAAQLRHDYPDIGTIFCGPNWRFGAGGVGDATLLASLGFRVEVVPFVMQGSANPISSTRIRAALSSGDLQEAARMLGRPYAVSGRVVSGKGLGRDLGFPTINVLPANTYLPRLLPLGVYAVSTPCGMGLANYGLAPTLGERGWKAPVLEVHLLDGVPPSDLATLKVELLRFVRPERRFDSLAELQNQIRLDCEMVRAAASLTTK